MLDVPHELVEHVSWLIYARRRELKSPWRRLGCFKQALLALAYLRKNETFAQVGAEFGVSQATAWRYVGETLDVLAAWAPGLHEALTGLGEGDFVIIDGTLIPTDEPYYSQKHKQHGMNVQVIARPDGTPLWVLLGHARENPRPHRSPRPRHRAGMPDPADPRPRGPRLPGCRRHGSHPVQEPS
jgi:hypothetical protein